MTFSAIRPVVIAAGCMLVVTWCAAPAFAQQAASAGVTASFIPIVGPNGDKVVIKGMNNSRTVVGIDTVLNNGVVIDASGKVTSFNVTAALGGSLNPVAINSSGEVVGTWLEEDKTAHVFFRSADGTITTDFSLNVSAITDLNDNGAITGSSGGHGFVRSRNGVVTLFDAPGANTTPLSINNSGAITGYYGQNPTHGFLRSPAGEITVFDVPGASSTMPESINAAGVIAGTWDGHGFVRDQQGTITEFSVGAHQNDLVVTNNLTINSKGEGAGFWHGLLGLSHGYLRSPHGTILFFDAPGSTASAACCINNSDVIAVNATNGAFLRLPGSQDDTFEPGTYLITDGHSLYVDGGFYLYGDATVRLWVLVGDNTAQYWKFTRVADGYTIENQGTSQYAYDAGGYLAEGARADVWTVHPVSGGYQIKNRRTGLFLTDPRVQDGAITLSNEGSGWQFLSLLPD